MSDFSNEQTAKELFFGNQTNSELEAALQDITNIAEMPFLFLLLNAKSDFVQGSPILTTKSHVIAAFQLLLNRLPENEEAIAYHVQNHQFTFDLVRCLLSSAEFRESIPHLIRETFPNSKIVWHIHATKTAGTTFYKNFWNSGWAVVNFNFANELAISHQNIGSQFNLQRLRTGIVFSGHVPLWRQLNYIKTGEPIVSFVRDPVERLVSNYRYMLTRYSEDPDRASDDVRFFFDIGFDPNSFKATIANGAFAVNEQTGMLCREAKCWEALEIAQAVGCDIVPFERCNDVVARLTGYEATDRFNVSSARRLTIPDELSDTIIAANAEDYALTKIIYRRYADLPLRTDMGRTI